MEEKQEFDTKPAWSGSRKGKKTGKYYGGGRKKQIINASSSRITVQRELNKLANFARNRRIEYLDDKGNERMRKLEDADLPWLHFELVCMKAILDGHKHGEAMMYRGLEREIAEQVQEALQTNADLGQKLDELVATKEAYRQ